MNLAETTHSLLRRWYIVVAGVIAAVVVAFAAWTQIPPTYTRSATELLLPGAAYVPTGDNPYLYLGGLGQAADVVVSALGSENVSNDYARTYPGVSISVSRDTQNSGPAIVLSVSATSDKYTGPALNAMVAQLSTTLEQIQAKEAVPIKDRITATSITIDQQSTPENKSRKLAAGASAAAVVLLSMIIAAFIEGLSKRARRRGSKLAGRRGAAEAVALADISVGFDLDDDDFPRAASVLEDARPIGGDSRERELVESWEPVPHTRARDISAHR